MREYLAMAIAAHDSMMLDLDKSIDQLHHEYFVITRTYPRKKKKAARKRCNRIYSLLMWQKEQFDIYAGIC